MLWFAKQPFLDQLTFPSESSPFLTGLHSLLRPALCPLHSCKWTGYLSAAFNARARCPFQPWLLQGQLVFSPLFPLLKPP